MLGRLALIWVSQKVSSVKASRLSVLNTRIARGQSCYVYLHSPSHRVSYPYPRTISSLTRINSLELIVWFVPSLIGGAVAVSFVGFVLGPMYPILMSYAARVLPRWLLSGSVGWIASLGQAGSAMLPFITGAVANNSGIKTLQPM